MGKEGNRLRPQWLIGEEIWLYSHQSSPYQLCSLPRVTDGHRQEWKNGVENEKLDLQKKGFQVLFHSNQFNKYAKLKTNKEMGFKMREKRTYKKWRRQWETGGSCRGCEMKEVYKKANQKLCLFKKTYSWRDNIVSNRIKWRKRTKRREIVMMPKSVCVLTLTLEWG